MRHCIERVHISELELQQKRKDKYQLVVYKSSFKAERI